MDVMGEACSIGSEVVELRQSLAVVTEALILFQEYIETEIGEMSYFRDSGSYSKLVETFNRLRPRVLGIEERVNLPRPPPPPPTTYHYQYHPQPVDYKPNFNGDGLMMISQACDEELKNHRYIPAPVIAPTIMQQVLVQRDDEHADVNVEVSEEDGTGGRIMINQVYSVSPPPLLPTVDYSGNFENPSAVVSMHPEEHVKEEKLYNGQQPPVLMDKSQFMIQQSQNQSVIMAPPASMPHAANERRIAPPLELRKNSATINPSSDAPHRGRKSSKHALKKALKKVKSKGVIMNGTSTNGGAGVIPINNGGVKTKGTQNRKSRKYLERPVKCPECSKSYSSRGVMSRHMKEVHQKDPQFTCFYCPLKFRNGPLRLEHMSKIHPADIVSITCPFCNRKSQSIAGKRNHMMLCAKKCNSPVADGEALEADTEQLN